MKVRRSAAVVALAATGSYAQMTTASPSTSYLIVTYDDCPSMSMETMITVTNGVTVTYCPECEMGWTSAAPQGPGYTTVYTTTYESLCPTGLVPATYTVTESCTDATPTWTPGPSHVPDGFTVTTKECTVCGQAIPTVTITEPCGCEATNGVPVTHPAANTTPASPGGGSGSGSGASPPAATIPAGGSGSSPPGSGTGTGGGRPACNGEDCGGSGNQSPSSSSPPGSSPKGSAPACNGEECGGSGNQSPSGSSNPGSPSSGSGSGGSSPSSACNGENCGGSGNQNTAPAAGGSGATAPPYPTAATATENCPGSNCRAAASSYPSGVSYGNTSGITPSPGAATSLSSFGMLSSLLIAVVAALAFLL